MTLLEINEDNFKRKLGIPTYDVDKKIAMTYHMDMTESERRAAGYVLIKEVELDTAQPIG